MSEARRLLTNILQSGKKPIRTSSPASSRTSGRTSPISPRIPPVTGPVLVKPHPNLQTPPMGRHQHIKRPDSLPYPSPTLYRFNSIVDAIESAELERSINAIAIICARSKYSLADAHASHRPPQGEISPRPRLTKKLSIVPEVNSSSEESAPNTGWRELDQQQTTQWAERSATARKMHLSALSSLRRFQIAQVPMVGVSKPSTERLPER
ncbi:hypothetical protein BDZ85DRAFT_31147 [Elsinoe ampelina]|uniref:Uncharacterized protein n=1 Tax=Elsinoe ampelina TaxID=302913 RepID=A0A6A6G5D0_9PEZI|nr:hypothetical protein BDZ85DRAFT_31147 [Elsinoe ampelina]